MVQFGDRLETLRNGETQKAFAKSLGIPINTYTNWVRGIREPSMNAIINICTQLSVSADWLLGLPVRSIGAANVTANGSHAIVAGPHAKVATGGDCSKCKLLKAHIREITGRD